MHCPFLSIVSFNQWVDRGQFIRGESNEWFWTNFFQGRGRETGREREREKGLCLIRFSSHRNPLSFAREQNLIGFSTLAAADANATAAAATATNTAATTVQLTGIFAFLHSLGAK